MSKTFKGRPVVAGTINKGEAVVSHNGVNTLATFQKTALAAWARGIGSCCMAFPVSLMKGSDACQPMIKKMGLSEGYDLIYCITMGYPDETPQAKARKEEKIVFVE